MKKILLYGDSNTYGYDPRGMLGMRYPYNIIWPSLLREKLNGRYEIIEEGENGRQLPRMPRDEAFLKSLTYMLEPGDIFSIMLGTNDILLTANPRPGTAVEKMNALIKWIKNELKDVKTIVVGPVYISDNSGDMREYYDASLEMNRGFEELCRENGVTFWNAGEWDISLAYDGVHFSEEGHMQFAKKYIELMEG
ncbi:MAG: hypothetical protein K6F00_09860 [Lachnospiraceae bacterium]|nr:hypothetical protein [Lachnospiraceae bacterium]